MDGLVTFAVVAFVMLFTASLPYVFVESRWRWRWREVEAGRVAADRGSAGIYRAAGDVPRYLHEAPRLIRWTAFSCFVFGQMFVPGLAMGLCGILAGGVGVVSIPGLITSAKIYRVGLSLLRRDPRRSVLRARDAAAWALWLNGIVFAFSLVFVPHAFSSAGTAVMIGIVDGYGLLSVLQALLMLHAVRKWEDALFADSPAAAA
ncbi:MAG TPA: hypothetical protein VGL86_04120 [Polyangia bacterium]